MRPLSILAVLLVSGLLGPIAAAAPSAADPLPGDAPGCAASFPASAPEASPALRIGEWEPIRPGEGEPIHVSCEDTCVMFVQACLAACPGTEYNPCRHACYDDYATCINGCWGDEVPDGP